MRGVYMMLQGNILCRPLAVTQGTDGGYSPQHHTGAPATAATAATALPPSHHHNSRRYSGQMGAPADYEEGEPQPAQGDPKL